MRIAEAEKSAALVQSETTAVVYRTGFRKFGIILPEWTHSQHASVRPLRELPKGLRPKKGEMREVHVLANLTAVNTSETNVQFRVPKRSR